MQTSINARPWRTLDWLRSLESVSIPVYQRDYRWSEDSCEQLIDDVLAAAAGGEGASHFIGSVLATQDRNGEVTLVDGQQRVTTLTLMTAVVSALAAENGEQLAGVDEVIWSSKKTGATKFRPHERNAELVARLLTRPNAVLGESPFETNYGFMHDRIGDSWLDVWAGMQRLEHVTVELTETANAQQVFESLNSTGAPLRDDELIHNYVHMGRRIDEQLEFERTIWAPIEQNVHGQIRDFWRDFMVMTSETHPELQGSFGIYKSFRARYSHPPPDITPNVQHEWLRLSALYGTLLDPATESDASVREQLVQLHEFGTAFRGLLLKLYDLYRREDLSRAGFVEAARKLQTMLVRRAQCGQDSDLRLIGRLCRELDEEGYSLDNATRRTPPDRQVEVALRHGHLRHPVFVLRRLQKPPTGESLDVEHIHPQQPSDDWAAGPDGTPWAALNTAEQADYRATLNTIGNLTLLESGINRGASNRSFRQKADRYYPQSKIPELRAISQQSSWGIPDIEARTDELTVAYLREWPRSTETSMDFEDLTRVVDLPDTMVRGYPAVFEYATCRDRVWDDVHTVKDLLAKVTQELWERDSERLLSSQYGDHLTNVKEPKKTYIQLPNGLYMYAGWSNRWLQGVVRSRIESFGAEDDFRVQLVS